MSLIENLLNNENVMREIKIALKPVGIWLFNETQFYLIIICVYSVALLIITLATLITLLNLSKIVNALKCTNVNEIYQELL
jgi:hypothetical protein